MASFRIKTKTFAVGTYSSAPFYERQAEAMNMIFQLSINIAENATKLNKSNKEIRYTKQCQGCAIAMNLASQRQFGC